MTERSRTDRHLSYDPDHDEVLSPAQVVEDYGPVFGSTAALANRRYRGDGPEFIKIAQARSGRVVYRRSAIEAWLRERTVKVEANA